MASVQRIGRLGDVSDAEELASRQVPWSEEAEQAVLGSILLLPEVCDEVALLLRPEDFYADANQRIFRHILALHEAGGRIDPTLLLERLRDGGDFERVGGSGYLLEVAQSVSTAAHAEYYARIIHDKSVLRALIHASTDIIHDAYEPAVDSREMLASAEERIFSILDEKAHGKMQSIREVMHDSLERIDARARNEHAFRGIDTGYHDLDDMTGGLHDSELIILAARPSMGKTALALNIAEHVAVDGRHPTLLVSLEMSSVELADRLLCSRSQVDGHKLRSGNLSNQDNQQLIRAANEMSEAPLFIDDSPSRTMTEIAATARRLKRRDGLKLIVVDYLQLISPDNARDPRQEQIARITRRMKGLARELSVPVLCLAQLNRQVEATRDNRPQLSHLRESGAIEQDADVVVFVHREEYYKTDEEDRKAVEGLADIMVKKQRNGRTGDIKLTWRHSYTRFENYQPDPYEELQPYDAEAF